MEALQLQSLSGNSFKSPGWRAVGSLMSKLHNYSQLSDLWNGIQWISLNDLLIKAWGERIEKEHIFHPEHVPHESLPAAATLSYNLAIPESCLLHLLGVRNVSQQPEFPPEPVCMGNKKITSNGEIECYLLSRPCPVKLSLFSFLPVF